MKIGNQAKNSSIALILLMLTFFGCKDPIVVDNTVHMTNNHWNQGQKIVTTFEADTNDTYDLSLRLRITADYKYHNLFVLFTISDTLNTEEKRRYTYKIADEEGQWTGKGSGNIFTYRLPLLKGRKFKQGKHTLIIEHNMRDNPLRGVTDLSIVVEKATDL